MKLKAVSGTQDFTPETSEKFEFAVNEIKKIAKLYNYREAKTPIFEYTDLFARSIGQETDIVSKEMYTFQDSGDKLLTLRPENTASIVRMVMEHSLSRENPQLKLFYFGPMFRRERPQKGRFRQFHQFGIEAIGPKSAALDAETILFAWEVYSRFGLKNLTLKLNSIGTKESRVNYVKELKKFLEPKLDTYCNDCKRRFEKNPLRVLDCKKDFEKNKDAPKITDFLSEESALHFQELKNILTLNKIPFQIDSRLVRGLDYYTDTVYEISSDDLGSQSAVCGGGRYDLLFTELGGQETAAVGFAGGFERLMMILEAKEYEFPKCAPTLFIANLDDQARIETTKIINELRKNDIACETDYLKRSLKAQMKYANKLNVKYSIVFGENELNSGEVEIKRMSDGHIEKILLTKLLNFFKNEIE